MRLFVEDTKGIMDVIDNVDGVKITTKGKTKYMFAYDTHSVSGKTCLMARKLTSIGLAYLLDTETMKEYFRYVK